MLLCVPRHQEQEIHCTCDIKTGPGDSIIFFFVKSKINFGEKKDDLSFSSFNSNKFLEKTRYLAKTTTKKGFDQRSHFWMETKRCLFFLSVFFLIILI